MIVQLTFLKIHRWMLGDHLELDGVERSRYTYRRTLVVATILLRRRALLLWRVATVAISWMSASSIL